MRVVGIIPARYASSRLSGKSLEMIGEVSMIMRVYTQVSEVNSFSEVVVATDDQRIYDHVRNEGGRVVMTSLSHETGTERCFEALSNLEENFDFIVNIQGDEPFVHPEQLNMLVASLDDSIEVATMCKKIESLEDLKDPNLPKLVFDELKNAIYFSRAPIPFVREHPFDKWLEHGEFYKHIGIYAYRRDILATIVKLKSSNIEMMEQLEQLRWISHGVKIHTVETEFESISVDTFEDLEKARGYALNN